MRILTITLLLQVIFKLLKFELKLIDIYLTNNANYDFIYMQLDST